MSRVAQVPGMKAAHAIVTDTCRENRGDGAAAHEAARRLIDEYYACLRESQPPGTQYHFVLTIERPAAGAVPRGDI